MVTVSPHSLLAQLHAIGARVAQSDLDVEMLKVLEDVVASLVRTPVRLPWHPPAQLAEVLTRALRRHPIASAGKALERLWFFFCAEGLVAKPLRQPGGQARSVEFAPAHLVAVGQAEMLARTVWNDLPPEDRAEEQYLAETLFLLSYCLSPPGLLASLGRAQSTDVDWAHGVIFLASSEHGRQPAARVPYRLDWAARLALGRLELFYRCHALRRGTELLPACWQRPGALAKLLTRWLRHHGHSDGARRYLIAMRLLLLLKQPALFGAVQTGRLPAGWRGHSPVEVKKPALQSGVPRCQPSPTSAVTAADESDVMAEVRWHLRRLEGPVSHAERGAIADACEALLPAFGGVTPPTNGALVTAWAIAMLRNHQLRPNTVRTYLTGLHDALDELLEASILALDANELAELMAELIFSQQTPNSQRTMKQRLRAFTAFLQVRVGLPSIAWRSLRVANSSLQISLVDMHEAEAAFHRFETRFPADARALQVATCLGFWDGLRRGELCGLAIDDLLGGRWESIRVRQSKTRTGRRTIPGALFTPPMIWRIVEAYKTERFLQAGTEHAPLLVKANGEPWDPDDLGDRISTVLYEVTKRRITLHSLRRGFATWTLLRWAVAKGLARSPAIKGQWAEAATAPSCGAGVLEALGGDDVLALPTLSRIMGHASPGVTVAHYCAVDVLQQAWFTMYQPVALRSGVAADLLQVSRPALHARLESTVRGWVDVGDVLLAQVDRLCRTGRSTLPQAVQ